MYGKFGYFTVVENFIRLGYVCCNVLVPRADFEQLRGGPKFLGEF